MCQSRRWEQYELVRTESFWIVPMKTSGANTMIPSARRESKFHTVISPSFVGSAGHFRIGEIAWSMSLLEALGSENNWLWLWVTWEEGT